jgi:hypothetical protein
VYWPGRDYCRIILYESPEAGYGLVRAEKETINVINIFD